MAIYTSLFLKSLLRNPRNSRTFLTATNTAISASPFAPRSHPLFQFPSSSPSQSHRFLSPFSNWFVPLHGPLFLSSPPWKLSQSATPLYLRGNAAVRRKIEALNLHLLRRRRTGFPLKLKFASVSPNQIVSDSVDSKRLSGDFVESFVNVPNMVSMSRLISGPFLGWMIVNEWYSYAMLGLAVSGATDWLDGYLARKMGINSVVGSYLDPLADKVLIGCVAVAMVQKDLLHPGLVGLVLFRDVGLVCGAVYQRASSLGWEWKSWFDFFNLDGTSPHKVEPLFISKVNTVLQLILVSGALLQPDFGTPETQPYITHMSWLVASTTVASTAAYGAHYMRHRSVLFAGKSW